MSTPTAVSPTERPPDAPDDHRILIVDDEPMNTVLLEKLLGRWGFTNVRGLTDPMAVFDACARFAPDLILLDLNMPGLSGFDVMRQLGPTLDRDTPIPILVLTADPSPSVKREALAAGARDFLTKPFDVEEVRLRVQNLLQMRDLQLKLKANNDNLEQQVRRRTRELEQSRLEVVERLALAAEFRDDDTQQHAKRIGHTAALLATKLGLTSETIELIHRAAPLHDVGKIAIPDAILLKPEKLTAEEFQIMKSHTTVGAQILSGGQSPLLILAEEIALTHHERWDGNGYPAKTAGQDTPLPGRIVAVADVFDALTHERPYKAAWPVDQALEEIINQRGRHFDPCVIEAFETLDYVAITEPFSGVPRAQRDTYRHRTAA